MNIKLRLPKSCAHAILLALVLVSYASAAENTSKVAAPDANPLAQQLAPFWQKHCVDCHGADSPKAGLRLDKPPADCNSLENVRTWTKILDRLESGEMPPKDSPRPTQAELAKATALLNQELLAADARSLTPRGSLVLRRMTRLQYENTIRDLFSINIELQERLPADTRVQGFDNIGAALSLSSAQLEIYLDAADAVLDASIITRPRPAGIKRRYSGIETVVESQNRVNGAVWQQEDVAIAFGKFQFYVGREQAPEEGMYRARMSMYGYQNGGEPVEIYVKQYLRSGDRVIGYYNVQPDVPQVLEIVAPLKKDGYIQVTAPKFNYIKRTRHPEEHKTPGLAVQWVEIEGPLFDAWPPLSHQALFGNLPMKVASAYHKTITVDSQQPEADAERLLRTFMPRAFRRPVTDDEVQAVLALVKQQLDDQQTFVEAMRVGYKAVLCSPEFLYFQEPRGAVDDFALASRLSYFLWNTMPDQELLELAGRHELHQPATLRAQTERLLKSPKSQRFVENFLGQWLDLLLIDSTTPDQKLYPEFNPALQEAMLGETRLFFNDLLASDGSVQNFIDSNYTFLNERLAAHYGIEGVKGAHMRRVALPPESHRGGVMTMASVLKVTANGSYTHPVHRGVWMLRNIVGKPPEPPPPNAGAVEPDLRGAKTIREQLNIHRQSETCAGCHVKIDPLGFALENFDVTGGWRDKYRILSGEKLTLSRNGPEVEAAYELPDGRPFKNIDELKKLMLEDQDQMARCLTEKLLMYSTGTALRFSDRAEVQRIVAAAREKNYGLRSLVHEVVQSQIFSPQ